MIHIEYMPNHGEKRFKCRCGCIWRASEADYHRNHSEFVTREGEKIRKVYFISKCPFCGRDVISDDREG